MKPTEIYFAHAIVDYNTEYEDLCLQTINRYYNHCIIYNPKDLDLTDIDEAIKFKFYFFPTIDRCDLVIAAPAFNHPTRQGQFLGGTTREIIYAIKNHKQVIALMNNELKEVKKEFFNDITWDVYGGNDND